MIVLDNNVLIEIERGNKTVVENILSLKEKYPQNIGITSAVYAEFLIGFLAVGKEKEAEYFIKDFDILDFDKESARIFALLKRELDKKGTPIPLFDLITAGTVIRRNATLASFDRHFEKVPGLRLILF